MRWTPRSLFRRNPNEAPSVTPGECFGSARVPAGVEYVLRKAAEDGRFQARLLADRGAALGRAGVSLGEGERAILLAIPDAQLEQMIATAATHLPRRSFLQRTVGAVVAALLGATATAVLPGCGWTGGARPDEPKGPTMGERPDRPPARRGGSGEKGEGR